MIRKTTLDNGAKIITEVVDEVYSASIAAYVNVGSEDEAPEVNGVSHCLEHMLFKGTKKRTAHEIAQEIEDVGGGLGAATSKENTCFYGRVMGEELPVAIDLITDMLLNARLDQQDLDLEREVILEEIKMYEDDPEDLSQEMMLLNIWPNHALSRPITGTKDTVVAMTSQMLKDHVSRFYRPENIVVSIAGKFDESRAIELLSKGLGVLEKGKPKPELPKPKHNSFVLIKDKDSEQAHISLATEGIAVTDKRRYPLAILDLCLGGNMSSRLFQEVREKRGLVYSISTYKLSHEHCGLFGVYAATGPGKVEPVLELVGEEFRRVKAEGLTDQEIKRAKTQLRSDLLLGLESMRQRTARNAYGELFFGRQLSVEEICNDIDKVTGDDVLAIANQILGNGDFSLVVVGPKKSLKETYSVAF